MWTDGATLGYNPQWVLDASFDVLKGTVAHCSHHTALCHHLRREGRNEKNWNKSCDVVVNAAMSEAGLALPKGVRVNSKDADRSAEEIYGTLPAEPKGDSNKPGEGEKGDQPSNADQPGECRDQKNQDGSSKSQSEIEEAIQDQLQDTAALAQQAKSMGDLPGAIARQIKSLLYPQLDWAQQLREFMLSLSTDDYSWNRPNRRFIHQGLYLPSLQSDGAMGKIVVAIDTSGSISTVKLEAFCTELNGILEECKPESVTVICCDTRIARVDEFGPDEYPISFNVEGGGGTDLRPPFDYLAEQGIEPDVFLYFTDCVGPKPESAPSYPVCWIDQNNNGENRYCSPNFGKIIGIPGNY